MSDCLTPVLVSNYSKCVGHTLFDAARHRLTGHNRPVEEVVFKPGAVEQLASVGDDYQVGV
jgi:hypothetical protein